jgi:hypothetical protein
MNPVSQNLKSLMAFPGALFLPILSKLVKKYGKYKQKFVYAPQ